MPESLSIGQAAKYIGVSRDTLRRWEKKGKITPRRSPTNRRYYTKEQLDILIKKPKKSAVSSPTPSSSLRLVIYSLLAVLAAVIIAFFVLVYLF